MKSDELTSGDKSSDGPQNSNVTAMSRALPPRCLCSSQVHQDKHRTCLHGASTGQPRPGGAIQWSVRIHQRWSQCEWHGIWIQRLLVSVLGVISHLAKRKVQFVSHATNDAIFQFVNSIVFPFQHFVEHGWALFATICDCHERTFCYVGISSTGP